MVCLLPDVLLLRGYLAASITLSSKKRLGQPHPVRRAGGEAIVVEVIAGVVHHAAALAVAIADDQIAARAALEQEGEVLAARERLHMGNQASLAEPVERDLLRKIRHGGVVD